MSPASGSSTDMPSHFLKCHPSLAGRISLVAPDIATAVGQEPQAPPRTLVDMLRLLSSQGAEVPGMNPPEQIQTTEAQPGQEQLHNLEQLQEGPARIETCFVKVHDIACLNQMHCKQTCSSAHNNMVRFPTALSFNNCSHH